MNIRRLAPGAAVLALLLSLSTLAGPLAAQKADAIDGSLAPLEQAGEVIHTGHVTAVLEGDALTVATADGRKLSVVIAGIDAPEPEQPWGFQARQQLSKLIFDKQVELRARGEDGRGNTVARVSVHELDAGTEMLRHGNAWVLPDERDSAMLDGQDKARQQKLGLWGQSPEHIVAPWEWRRQAAPASGGAQQSLQCGDKTSCMQMHSCEEATFYLKQCGVKALDWDGDGIPCRALCRP